VPQEPVLAGLAAVPPSSAASCVAATKGWYCKQCSGYTPCEADNSLLRPPAACLIAKGQVELQGSSCGIIGQWSATWVGLSPQITILLNIMIPSRLCTGLSTGAGTTDPNEVTVPKGLASRNS
jgi:hypothetical protein